MDPAHVTVLDAAIGEQRRFPRIQTGFKALFADSGGSFREEDVLNVSKGGLYLKSRAQDLHARPGEKIEVILMLPSHEHGDGVGDREVTVQAQVMHVHDFKEENCVGLGLMFTAVEPNLKAFLTNFIERLFDPSEKNSGGGKRRTPRIDIMPTPFLLKSQDQDQEQTAVLCNISRNGMYIRTAEPLSLFNQVKMSIRNQKPAINLELNGEVVHVHKEASGLPPFGAGVRFTDLKPESQKMVYDWVRRILN